MEKSILGRGVTSALTVKRNTCKQPKADQSDETWRAGEKLDRPTANTRYGLGGGGMLMIMDFIPSVWGSH